MNEPLHGWEITLYALHLEGGASTDVHTEDVAVRCFALAPDAFSWVKHRQFPDKDIVRQHLSRLRRPQHGDPLVTGRAGRTRLAGGLATAAGWKLTRRGVRWIVEHRERLERSLQHRQPRADRQDLLRSLARVRGHRLFEQFQGDRESFVPPLGELAELLRCRVDSDEEVWHSRFATMRNQAELASQADLAAFLERCEALRPALT